MLMARVAVFFITCFIAWLLLYIVYMIVTWPDRKRERIGFRLNVLKFGLENGLDDGEIVDALCASFIRRKTMVPRIKKRLERGLSLVKSLSMSQRIFPGSVTAVLRAGEEMGDLPRMVSHAERQMDFDRSLYTRINMQFLYPLYLLVFTGTPVSISFIFIYPEFAEMIDELSDEVYGLEDIWHLSPRHVFLMVWGAIGLCVTAYIIFHWRLSVRKKNLTFVQVLSSAILRNLNEDTALELAGDAADSRRFQRATGKARRLLKEGADLKEAVAGAFAGGERMLWFFNQSRQSDAAEVLETWAGMLRDALDRRADVFSQALSTLIVLCVGVCAFLLAYTIFNMLITLMNLLM